MPQPRISIQLALAERAAFTVAAVALDIHLRRRLGEREVMRTETNNRVLAVQLLCEQLENALQVAHADALIDNQTLDLMEQRRVGCINGVRTVNTARRDNADRRLALSIVRTCIGEVCVRSTTLSEI